MSEKKKDIKKVASQEREEMQNAIELVLNIKEIEKEDPEAIGRIKAFIDGVNAGMKKA